MARVLDLGQNAVGIVAIGQFATGVIAIGQVATGVIAIGQVSRGVVAIGMGAIGAFAVGMGSCGVAWGSGMIVVGGRVGAGMIKIPLVPRLPKQFTATWAVKSAAQLAGLVAAAIAFWLFVAIPLGDSIASTIHALAP